MSAATPVWWCEVHEELGHSDKCWIGVQHPAEALACEMETRLLVDPSALVIDKIDAEAVIAREIAGYHMTVGDAVDAAGVIVDALVLAAGEAST